MSRRLPHQSRGARARHVANYRSLTVRARMDFANAAIEKGTVTPLTSDSKRAQLTCLRASEAEGFLTSLTFASPDPEGWKRQ